MDKSKKQQESPKTASTAKIKEAIAKYEEAVDKAFKREMYKFAKELENDVIDARRDW